MHASFSCAGVGSPGMVGEFQTEDKINPTYGVFALVKSPVMGLNVSSLSFDSEARSP